MNVNDIRNIETQKRQNIIYAAIAVIVLVVLYFGLQSYLTHKIEKVILATFQDEQLSYSDISVSPFTRSVRLKDFDLKGIMGKNRNRVGAETVDIRHIRWHGNQITRADVKASHADVFIARFFEGPNRQSKVYDEISFAFNSDSHGSFYSVSDFKLIGDGAQNVLVDGKADLKNVTYADERMTHFDFSASGRLPARPVAVAPDAPAPASDADNTPQDMTVDAAAAYDFDPATQTKKLTNFAFNVPQTGLAVGFKEFMWARDMSHPFPNFIHHKLSEFKVSFPMGKLATLFTLAGPETAGYSDLMTSLGLGDINGEYSFNFDYNPDTKNVTVDGNVKAENLMEFSLKGAADNLDFTALSSENPLPFLQGAKLRTLGFSYVDAGLLKKYFAYKKDKQARSEESLIKEALAYFDDIFGDGESPFLTQTRGAMRRFLVGKNSFEMTMNPAAPVSFSDILQLVMVAPAQLGTALGAQAVGQ